MRRLSKVVTPLLSQDHLEDKIQSLLEGQQLLTLVNDYNF